MILNKKFTEQKQRERKAMRDYKRHIKEIRQGFPEPKTPPKMTEKEIQDLKIKEMIAKEKAEQDGPPG